MNAIRITLGIVSWILFIICLWNFGGSSEIRDGIYAIIFLLIANDNLKHLKSSKEDE